MREGDARKYYVLISEKIKDKVTVPATLSYPLFVEGDILEKSVELIKRKGSDNLCLLFFLASEEVRIVEITGSAKRKGGGVDYINSHIRIKNHGLACFGSTSYSAQESFPCLFALKFS